MCADATAAICLGDIRSAKAVLAGIEPIEPLEAHADIVSPHQPLRNRHLGPTVTALNRRVDDALATARREDAAMVEALDALRVSAEADGLLRDWPTPPNRDALAMAAAAICARAERNAARVGELVSEKMMGSEMQVP